jgi:hypothetical protein
VEIIHKKNYQQLKQINPEEKNLEENEIRHPMPPDLNVDKDARYVSRETAKME